MRGFLQIVGGFFILLGILAIVFAAAALLQQAGRMGSLEQGLGIWLAALSPGGMIVIFGSTTYLLCSIDQRLEDMGSSLRMRTAGSADGSPPA